MPLLFGRRRSKSIERPLPHQLTEGERRVSVGRVVRGVAIVSTLALLASACSMTNDLGNPSNGPLGVLKVSDVVVETNLQSVATAADGITAGITTTSGPSLGYKEISVSSAAGHPTILAGYNNLSRDCLGMVEITTPGFPVLGETQPGTYDFWLLGTPASACDAASFSATTSVPTGWPAGDPTSSGFPIT
jgi:hypothetical protein